MSIISTHPNMNKIYYSSESSISKQTLAYLNASFKELLAIDVTKTNVTGTQWKDLAEHLDMNISDFVDKDVFNFSAYKGADTELSETDWIKVLNNNPEVLTRPIIIIGTDYHLIKNPSDVDKLLDPNSKGIV
jgi:arsenate reductase-like glutaredoxin family protein